MKNSKYILHSVAVLAVAALATACSSEDELTDKTSGSKETVTITAYQPNTRVGFDKNGDGYWQSGDEIGVWSNGESKFSTFTIASEDAGKASATFSGTVTDGIGQYAVYPYNDNHSLSDNTLTYYLPSKYTYTSVDQTFLPTDKNGNNFCMPMYGEIANNEVSFKHLGGVICIKIDKMPAESGTVKVIEATNKLCGMFTANLSDETPEIKTAQSESNNAVTFVYSGATKDAVGVFYLPVATGNYNLTIEVSGNKQFSTTTSGTVDVTRAHLKVVKVATNYTTSTASSDGSVIINGHKFIDLGLPSGILWAETNIGAKTASDDGNYYAWGETATKDTYTEDNYTYYDTSSSSYTKYTSTDNKTALEDSDDAAYVNWGSSCRMPTQAEFTELCNTTYCTWTWTSNTNSSNETIDGYEVTSKTNGNSIFLPASGFCHERDLDDLCSCGYYWSSTLGSDDTSTAFGLCFNNGRYDNGDSDGDFDNGDFYGNFYGRLYGYTVRPVAEP